MDFGGGARIAYRYLCISFFLLERKLYRYKTLRNTGEFCFPTII